MFTNVRRKTVANTTNDKPETAGSNLDRNTVVHGSTEVPAEKRVSGSGDNNRPNRTSQERNRRNFSKVSRLLRPSNDNSVTESERPYIETRRLLRPQNNDRLQAARQKPIKEVANTFTSGVKAANAAWFIVGTTWIFYMIQFTFAMVALAGVSSIVILEGSWWDYVDFLDIFLYSGNLITYAGIGITTVMGIFTLILAIMIFAWRGVRMTRRYSIFIMAFCFALNALPGTSLFPWIWFWCLYVVKSQASK